MSEPARADVCIVGAGAAGMTLAHALRDAALSVVIVESGPVDDQASLDEGEVVGLPYNGLLQGRRRGLGGTTTVWPGQCMRLRPDDLECWPVEAAELARWYDEAERLLGLVPGETTRDPWELFGEPGPGFDPSRLVSATGVLAPARDLSRLDVGGARVLLRTTATAVAAGRVEVRDSDGHSSEIRADTIVLCAGTYETTRLLLVSGFRHEALGRFFQDHAACRPAAIVGVPARSLQDRYGMRFREGRTYVPKLLRASSLPGCMASIVFDYPADSPVEAGLRIRRALRGRRLPRGHDVLSAVRGAPQLAAAAARVARGREPAPRPDAVRVFAVLEQAPRSESTLSLSDTVDPLGQPRLRVDWRLGEEEHRSLQTFVATLDAELQRTGSGRLEVADWVESRSWQEEVFDVFHPAGTTRMGAEGVVDADCRLHGTPGIAVCSASVFPASGCVNPTLTIVALALRQADCLRSA